MSFFFQAEDGIRDVAVTGVQTCALPISFCPLSAAPSRISSLLSAASCPPSGTGVHLLRPSCVELWLALTMQHSRRQAVSKQQFVSFGISFLISSLRKTLHSYLASIVTHEVGLVETHFAERAGGYLQTRTNVHHSINPKC